MCTGINPYYLEMIKKLNKDLKGELKILEIVYSTRSKYNPIFGFYRLLDKADNFLGVVCGIIHSKDYFNKIEKI